MRVIDFFDRAASQFSDRPCLIEGDDSWTYEEVRSATCVFASLLSSKVKGDAPRIAVLAPNCTDAIVAVLSIFRLGAIWIPANSKMPAEDIGAFLVTTRCDLLIAHPTRLKPQKWEKVQQNQLRQPWNTSTA